MEFNLDAILWVVIVIAAIVVIVLCICRGKKRSCKTKDVEKNVAPCEIKKRYKYVSNDDPAASPSPLQCSTAIMETACFSPQQEDDTPTDLDMDLTTFQLPATPTIDWSTFQFGDIDVYSHHAVSLFLPNCRQGGFENAPFGTHLPASFTLAQDACGPATETAPGVFLIEGCGNSSGTITTPNGASYTHTWTHDNNGIVNCALTTVGVTSTSFFTYWRVNYTVEDVDGCSYDHIMYYNFWFGT